MLRARDLAVRLLMVNWRVRPRVPVAVGAEVGLGGDDLEAGVFGGVGAGEGDGVVGGVCRAW